MAECHEIYFHLFYPVNIYRIIQDIREFCNLIEFDGLIACAWKLENWPSILDFKNRPLAFNILNLRSKMDNVEGGGSRKLYER